MNRNFPGPGGGEEKNEEGNPGKGNNMNKDSKQRNGPRVDGKKGLQVQRVWKIKGYERSLK